MSQLALNASRPWLSSLSQAASASYQRLSSPSSRREIVILGIIISSLQILDGAMTAMGVHHLGTEAEGNLFIRYLMELLGPNLALILVKSFAIAIVVMLCLLAKKVPWIPGALRGVACLYLCAAILPWSYILLTLHNII
ncbi:MAG: hypothetical protein KDD42_05845 [Bdellovibrionales bacterium]|nr:hypothetical protein [Bdellovibrionales bacterium]